MANAASDGVHVWELASRKKVAHLEIEETSDVWFLIGQQAMIVSGQAGVQRVNFTYDDDANTLQIADVQPIVQEHGNALSVSGLSSNGRFLVYPNDSQQLSVADLDAGSVLSLQESTRVARLAVSDTGSWIAGGLIGGGIRMWNGRSGEAAYDLPNRGAVLLVLSGDGKWLATWSEQGYQLWSVGTWRPIQDYAVPRDGVLNYNFAAAAFSPGGKTLATRLERGLSD